MSEDTTTIVWTVNEKNKIYDDIAIQSRLIEQMTQQIIELRKDLNDLVLLLYGTRDVPAVTTNENTEDA